MTHEIYKPKLNPDGSRYVDPVTNDFVNELAETIDSGPDEVMTPNWRGLTDDLFRSVLFQKAIQQANPNVYSTFTKILTDGEFGKSNENILREILTMFTFFTSSDISELNTILSNNHFTIQL